MKSRNAVHRALKNAGKCGLGRLVVLSVLVSALTIPCFGQATGTITGRVMDEQQAFIPGATVTVENAELSIQRVTQSGPEGVFAVTNLPVGVYSIKVDATNFAPYAQTNIKLDVGSTFDRTIVLRIGAVAELVTVTEQVYQTVNTETANVETLVSGTQVRELSLNGRNWAQLLNLVPGTSAFAMDAQQGTNVRIDDTAINGLRRRFVPTLDGASNVDHGSVATQVNNISVDAIEEFKLVSSPYSAEFGMQAGPAINVVTKRGTNSFHGTAFEFFRHDKLNAYAWESKQVTTGAPQKPRLRYNNFGGFVGGPLIKDKLFIFGGLEWKLPRTGRTLNEQVPTLAMRTGNFSAFLPTSSGAITSCSQTLSAADRTAGKFILCDKSASTTGVPFAGNVIPGAKMSPNGLALVNLFPQPNSGDSTFIAAPVSSRKVREDLVRVDWVATSKINLYGRWIRDNFTSDNPLGSTFDNQAMPIAPDNHERVGNTVLGSMTHIINTSLLNELSVAWQRNDQSLQYQDLKAIDRSTHGINFTEIFPENRLNKIPELNVQGYSVITGNGLPYNIKAQSWEVRDNLTKTWGVHTLKTGMLFVRAFKQENTRVRDGGIFTFITGTDASFRPQDSNSAVANLLLGAYQRYQEPANTTNVPTSYNQWEFYVNDQWRVNRRLSLTFGLRYQYIPWPVAEDHRIIGFDPARFDPAKAPLAANIVGGAIRLTPDPSGTRTRADGFYDPYNGIVLPGCKNPFGNANLDRLFTCRPGGLATSGKNGWAPRFGFALDPTGRGKTSIRGGAGIYYDRTLLNPLRDAGGNPPFTSQSIINNGRQYTTPASIVTTFSNPLDTVGANGPGQPLLQALAAFAPEMRPGAVYAYSFSVQRELPWASMIDLSYVGNQGRFLTHRRDANYVPASAALEVNPVTGRYVNAQGDTVRQNLGYQSILLQENTGNSSYNSLQINFQKRTTAGLTGSVAYTYSKALNNFDSETANLRVPFDAGYDRSYADFDRRHVLALSYVYELPWFKAQRGLAGRVLGGWEISGTTIVQSGRHFNISGGTRDTNSPSNGYAGNVDMIGDWRAIPSGYPSNQWINPLAFTGRLDFIAAMPRNVIEMPLAQFWNLSFMKKTKVSERVTLQFRAETFNFFNHPNFRNVQLNFSSRNFGQLTETEDPRVFQFGLKLLF